MGTPTSPVFDALKTIKLRYPGEPDLIPLSKLVSENRLAELLKQQYPNSETAGNVQFIPEARGIGLTYQYQ